MHHRAPGARKPSPQGARPQSRPPRPRPGSPAGVGGPQTRKRLVRAEAQHPCGRPSGGARSGGFPRQALSAGRAESVPLPYPSPANSRRKAVPARCLPPPPRATFLLGRCLAGELPHRASTVSHTPLGRGNALLALSGPNIARLLLPRDLEERATLGRMMCNCSDEKVGQVAQRPPKLIIETLSAGVGCDLAAKQVNSPLKVFARWRSRAKRSLSWSMTPSIRLV